MSVHRTSIKVLELVKLSGFSQKLKPKKAILTHMGHWLDYNELKNKCPNNVEPGIDGMVIKI